MDQRPEPPPTRRLLTWALVRLHDTLRRCATLANRREFGLTGLEFKIMGQVGVYAPLSLNDLAELVVIDTGQLSRAVKGLVERGLLDRKRRPGGPAIDITLSEKGVELHEQMVVLAVERNDFITSDLSAEEVEQAIRMVEALKARAQIMFERERALARAAGCPEKED